MQILILDLLTFDPFFFKKKNVLTIEIFHDICKDELIVKNDRKCE